MLRRLPTTWMPCVVLLIAAACAEDAAIEPSVAANADVQIVQDALMPADVGPDLVPDVPADDTAQTDVAAACLIARRARI